MDATEGARLECAVQQVLAYAANCGVEQVTPEAKLRDLGIDSVGSSAVVVVLEAETGVAIGLNEIVEFFAKGTVGDLVQRLAEVRRQPL